MDTNDRYLATQTSPFRYQRAAAIPCVCFALIGLCFGFGGYWIAALAIIGIAALTAAIFIPMASKSVWKIVFRNSTVTVTCRSEYFHLDTVKAYEFSFEQSESQKAKNRGNIRITGLNYRGQNFPLLDVENFSEVKKYVEANF